MSRLPPADSGQRSATGKHCQQDSELGSPRGSETLLSETQCRGSSRRPPRQAPPLSRTLGHPSRGASRWRAGGTEGSVAQAQEARLSVGERPPRCAGDCEARRSAGSFPEAEAWGAGRGGPGRARRLIPFIVRFCFPASALLRGRGRWSGLDLARAR